MASPARRVFSAANASDLAEAVVDYDPDAPRERRFIPEDREAAKAGVAELAARLQRVWRSIRKALKNASDRAGFLSDDRLQWPSGGGAGRAACPTTCPEMTRTMSTGSAHTWSAVGPQRRQTRPAATRSA